MSRQRLFSTTVCTTLVCGMTFVWMALFPAAASAQRGKDLEVTVEVRFLSVSDRFLERIGIDFDFNVQDNVGPIGLQVLHGLPKKRLTPKELEELRKRLAGDPGLTSGDIPVILGRAKVPNGGFPVSDFDIPFYHGPVRRSAPVFGGFDADAAADMGFAILSDIEVFFLMQAAQGDQRSNVLQAPKVTMFDGQSAFVTDNSQSPFVTSLNPKPQQKELPTDPVVMDDNGLIYNPRVVGVMAGQPLKFKNSDGVLHNVHGLPKKFLNGDDEEQGTGTVPLSPSSGGLPAGNFDIPFYHGPVRRSAPVFGGFDADAAADMGFAILSDIEVFFLMQAAQGDQRSNVLQAPKVTMFDGQSAFVTDAAQGTGAVSLSPREEVPHSSFSGSDPGPGDRVQADFDSLIDLIQSTTAPSGWDEADKETGPDPGPGGGVRADFDSLIDLIQSTTAPSSWDEAPENGTSDFSRGNNENQNVPIDSPVFPTGDLGGISYFTSPEPPIREDLQVLGFPAGVLPPFLLKETGTVPLLPFWLEGFYFGNDFSSVMAARRETDVLLTQGFTHALGGEKEAYLFPADNGFIDWDESKAENMLGWNGFTESPLDFKLAGIVNLRSGQPSAVPPAQPSIQRQKVFFELSIADSFGTRVHAERRIGEESGTVPLNPNVEGMDMSSFAIDVGDIDGVDVSTLGTSSSSHDGASSGVHGVTGSVVGTTDCPVKKPNGTYKTDDDIGVPKDTWNVAMARNDKLAAGDGQWGLQRIGLTRELHEQIVAAKEIAGSPVVVAVIDTGVDLSHPELLGQLWRNRGEIPFNRVDDDGNGYVDDVYGCNTQADNSNVWDDNGHGTAVAGIIAARWDDRGMAGVAPNCRVMIVKAFNQDGRSDSARVALAIRYAVLNGANIIHISAENDRPHEIDQAMVDWATENGVLVVAAAGSKSRDTANISPAGLRGVLTVGACDQNDRRAEFSGWGQEVDLVAPGVDILSLRAAGTDFHSVLSAGDPNVKPGESIIDQQWYRADGTSFSAPLVTGVAAALWATDPELTAEAIKNKLLMSCDDLEQPGWDILTGAGRLNVAKALDAEADHFLHTAVDTVTRATRADRPALEVSGRAVGTHFDRRQLQLAFGENPAEDDWSTVETSRDTVADGTLGYIPGDRFDRLGTWSIRSLVQDSRGAVREARGTIVIR